MEPLASVKEAIYKGTSPRPTVGSHGGAFAYERGTPVVTHCASGMDPPLGKRPGVGGIRQCSHIVKEACCVPGDPCIVRGRVSFAAADSSVTRRPRASRSLLSMNSITLCNSCCCNLRSPWRPVTREFRAFAKRGCRQPDRLSSLPKPQTPNPNSHHTDLTRSARARAVSPFRLPPP